MGLTFRMNKHGELAHRKSQLLSVSGSQLFAQPSGFASSISMIGMSSLIS